MIDKKGSKGYLVLASLGVLFLVFGLFLVYRHFFVKADYINEKISDIRIGFSTYQPGVFLGQLPNLGESEWLVVVGKLNKISAGILGEKLTIVTINNSNTIALTIDYNTHGIINGQCYSTGEDSADHIEVSCKPLQGKEITNVLKAHIGKTILMALPYGGLPSEYSCNDTATCQRMCGEKSCKRYFVNYNFGAAKNKINFGQLVNKNIFYNPLVFYFQE